MCMACKKMWSFKSSTLQNKVVGDLIVLDEGYTINSMVDQDEHSWIMRVPYLDSEVKLVISKRTPETTVFYGDKLVLPALEFGDWASRKTEGVPNEDWDAILNAPDAPTAIAAVTALADELKAAWLVICESY